MVIVREYDDDNAKVRRYDHDSTRFYRVITIELSRYHHCTLVFSTITIALSYFHHDDTLVLVRPSYDSMTSTTIVYLVLSPSYSRDITIVFIVFSYYHHRTLLFSKYHHRDLVLITIVLSRYRHRILVLSLSYSRELSPSYSRTITIALSHYRRRTFRNMTIVLSSSVAHAQRKVFVGSPSRNLELPSNILPPVLLISCANNLQIQVCRTGRQKWGTMVIVF